MLISIIVPCYNQAHFLNECLQTVINQTYQNWECIIVNDGSPDNTEEVAKKWIDKDSRFKYIYKPNGGLSSARNAGLKIACGSYIQFLDADDAIHSSKLFESFSLLSNTSTNELVISNFSMFQYKLDEFLPAFCSLQSNDFSYQSILYSWDVTFSIPIHCGFFNSSFFIDFQFPEHLKAKEDWVMWLHIFKKNPTVFFIDKKLAYYRQNPNGLTKNLELMKKNEIDAILYLKNILKIEEYLQLLEIKLQIFNQNLVKSILKNRELEKMKGVKLIKKIYRFKNRFKVLGITQKLL
jgi:glycosyltransferase involved in cell wall biosynthesis